MIIESVSIVNYRSIKEEKLECDDNLTTLVGPNGSGKSSFLNAIRIFFTRNDNVITKDDFYDIEKKQISISIIFKCLSKKFTKHFFRFITNGLCTIDKVFYIDDNNRIKSRYYVPFHICS